MHNRRAIIIADLRILIFISLKTPFMCAEKAGNVKDFAATRTGSLLLQAYDDGTFKGVLKSKEEITPRCGSTVFAVTQVSNMHVLEWDKLLAYLLHCLIMRQLAAYL